jgi:hypothetical protein
MAEGAWPVGEQEVADEGGRDEAGDDGRVIITSSAEGGGAVE